MIIPEFKLKQSERCIEVFIRVPYIKVSSCEFYIQANTFKFYLKPYLLSLSFEQRLKETEEPMKAVYYHDKYILQVHLEKQTASEFFNGLDLISNVVNKKKQKKKNSKVLVQVIAGHQPINENSQNEPFNEYNYGFSMNYFNVLDNLQEECLQLFAFNPKDTPFNQRLELSKAIIRNQFDLDSYLYDKYENEEEINYMLKDHYFVQYIQEMHQQDSGVSINSEEYKVKSKISGRQLLVSKKMDIRQQIVSIAFSYLYELICMSGDFGPESAKTINKTSLVLYCNASYQGQTTREMIADCYRRCMTYSLYKTIDLCHHVRKTLVKYLSKQYLKLFLQDLHRLFDKNQPRYLLNRIFIDDYLLYLYSKQADFQQFTQDILLSQITQKELSLGIVEYENQKQEQISFQAQQKKLVEEIQRLNTLD